MRVIIGGGRSYRMDAIDWRRLDALHAGELDWLGCHGTPVGPIDAVYEGEAPGADTGARLWAESRGIPVVRFPAEWTLHGDAAGPLRNSHMIAGRAPVGAVPRPDLYVRFPGGDGTLDMTRQARAADLPVLDLSLPRAQRWGAEELRDLDAVTSATLLYDAGARSEDDSARAALRITAMAHGGLGVPCCSAHLFRGSDDRIRLPAGALYVGRPGMIAMRAMVLPPDGDGSVLGNPVSYQGAMSDEQTALALAQYRCHLRDLYLKRADVRALLDRIAEGGTLLVCWCHTNKPCHSTVIAEAALLARAARELRAKGFPKPPPDLPVSSSRSKPTRTASAGELFAGVAS